MSIYGVVRDAAGGHVVTTILIAMVAMLFTAVSYGRMARVYPSAGSAYTYVGKEIHPLAGYVVGWSILMDYILNPLHCAIWARCSGTKHFAADSLCGIGFDGSSTMSEEVENPRRNILLATALSCFAIGVLSAVEVYLAQLAWPARAPFPASMVGYHSLCTGGASRGRQLPFPITQCDPADCEYGLWDRGSVRSGTSALWHGARRCASETILWCRESQTRIPRNSVPLLRAVTLLGAFLLTFERGAELLNFGAFIAFIGVNAAAIIHYRFRSQEKVAFPLLFPLREILVCAFIWLNLNLDAKLLGAAWIGVGLLFYFVTRKKAPSRRRAAIIRHRAPFFIHNRFKEDVTSGFNAGFFHGANHSSTGCDSSLHIEAAQAVNAAISISSRPRRARPWHIPRGHCVHVAVQ
jgi:amino acid transporter